MQQNFSELLIKPQLISKKQGREFLENLVKKFSYCQPASMMYAKALMENKSALFEQQLNIASALAPNLQLFRAYLAEKRHTVRSSDKPVGKVDKGRHVITETKTTETGSPDSDESKIARQQSIIDRFLEKEPRIQQGSESNVSEGDLAAESIEDKDDLASETLAEILLNQGKKERAIKIYHKLSLMFPEKISYFAKKLEHIQSENN